MRFPLVFEPSPSHFPRAGGHCSQLVGFAQLAVGFSFVALVALGRSLVALSLLSRRSPYGTRWPFMVIETITDYLSLPVVGVFSLPVVDCCPLSLSVSVYLECLTPTPSDALRGLLRSVYALIGLSVLCV